MSYKKGAVIILVLFVGVAVSTALAGEKTPPPAQKIPKGAKVFVAPMEGGYDSYLKEAIAKKKVPVEIVASRDQAEYEITGTSESQKASTAKKVILGNWHSREEASITVSSIKSSEVVWAYSVHEEASTHGKKSSAEACAKHLKEAIESQ
jgi:hypothetical protein